MPERVYEARLERSFRASRLTVWGLVSDTNRWDRASGLAAGRYSWSDRDGVRVRMGSGRELGFDIEWIEPPYEWIEGRFVHGERRFSKGPVARGGFTARLEDGGSGLTKVDATAYVAGPGVFMPFIGPVMKRKFHAALSKYFDGLATVLKKSPRYDTPSSNGMNSAAIDARDLIARQPYDALTQGPRSPVAEKELEHRASRLRQTLRSPLVDQLTSALAERPDEEVSQMRPFELAERWNVDRRELLRVFLHATRAGLVDLKWQINCPVCRVSAQVVGALADVTGSVHCGACNIGYGVDFGKHVEAVFQCHGAIREVESQVFCASSPAFLPHVVAQLSLVPGRRRTEPADLKPGELHLRLLSGGSTDVTLEPGASLRVSVEGDRIHATSESSKNDESSEIDASADTAKVVVIERTGIEANAVLGSVIATFPDFIDLFATEAPATGVELSVAHLALLFSDLTGSTALYGRVGDARAFALVQEHFRDMTEAVTLHRGAVVKTMGDSVMASFASETDAVRAALAMIERCHDRHASIGLSAKLGVCAGPCLAVRANERLDFFGTTVNLAARLQACASGGQLVLTEELALHPGISGLIAPFPASPFKAALKGIATEQALVAIDVKPRRA